MADDDTQQPVTATTPDPDASAQPTQNAGADPSTANQQPQGPQTQSPSATATIPDQPVQSSPAVLTPVRRGGLAGIVDEFRDAVAGKTSSQVYIDPNTGEKYIQHPDKTGAQQWARIGELALRGAAQGLANGKGAGNGGRALLAGVQDEQQQAQQQAAAQNQEADADYNRQRQAKLDTINSQLLQTKLAANQFALTRMGVQAHDQDIQWSQQQEDRQKQMGSALVGDYESPDQFFAMTKTNPDYWKDHVKDNSLAVIPRYDADGKPSGISVWKELPGAGNQMAPKGSTFRVFVPPAKPGDQPSYKEVTPSGDVTMGQLNVYNQAAQTQYQDWQKADVDARDKEAQIAERKANIAKAPSEIARNQASAARDRAETEQAQHNDETGGTALVDDIGSGRIPISRLTRVLGKNPQLLDQVAAKYPGFDASKVEAYTRTYDDFTSGKTSVALNAGGTALKHLSELSELNTVGSHVPHTPAWTRYQNKANTVATELAKFYGSETVPGIDAIKDTLTSTLPGNRNAAITSQAKSMGDKLDSYEQQWHNAAPSAAYRAPMPGIDAAAKAARAELDPGYGAKAASTVTPVANPFSSAPRVQ